VEASNSKNKDKYAKLNKIRVNIQLELKTRALM
jgi:hypothetical protein